MEVRAALQGCVAAAPCSPARPSRSSRPDPPPHPAALPASRAAGLREPGAHRRGAPPPPRRPAAPSRSAATLRLGAVLLRRQPPADACRGPGQYSCCAMLRHAAAQPCCPPASAVQGTFGTVRASARPHRREQRADGRPQLPPLHLWPQLLPMHPLLLNAGSRCCSAADAAACRWPGAPFARPPQVLKCRNRKTGEIVAIKKFKSRIDGENADAAQARAAGCRAKTSKAPAVQRPPFLAPLPGPRPPAFPAAYTCAPLPPCCRAPVSRCARRRCAK